SISRRARAGRSIPRRRRPGARGSRRSHASTTPIMSESAAAIPAQPPASSLVLCDLTLSPSDPALVLPPLCAGCGAPAKALLSLANAFERPVFKYAHAGRPNDDTAYHIVHARMPCCEACRRQHEAELPRRSPLFYAGTLFTSETMIFVVCA